MGDIAAEEQDLFDHEFEEELSKKSKQKTGRLNMVKSHVADQEGSASMATRVRVKSEGRLSCKALFWWFTISPARGENVEQYPDDKKLKWDNYSINWTRYLKEAIGPEGGITEEKLNVVFKGDLTRIPPTCSWM